MAASGAQKGAKTLVKIGSFLEEWRCALDKEENMYKVMDDQLFSAHIRNTRPYPSEIINKLEVVCHPSTLNCPGESTEAKKMLQNIPDGLNLHCASFQKTELEKRTDSVYSYKALREQKYRDYLGPWEHEDKKKKENQESLLTEPEVIISVIIYKSKSSKPRLPLVQQVFDVLGRQTLSELRDRIVCLSDSMLLDDHSGAPHHQGAQCAADVFKSRFFFIEGVFYNDTRDPTAGDISREIIDWAADQSRGLGKMTKASMETTLFSDLSVKLGQQYTYCHQGDCEHSIVFNDIRLLNAGDCLDPQLYPVETMRKRWAVTKCRVCLSHSARWVTTGSPLTPEDPYFFCDTCFNSLHYDASGKRLVFGFKAYRFPDREPI